MPRALRPFVRRGRAVLGAASIAAAITLAVASPAHAHTDVDYTLPADQEQVAQPVSHITVSFTDPVTLVGAGFEVFTPQEVIVQPGVVTGDNMVFVLQLDAPLVGGAAGVRYEVAAADGHVIEGGFSFTVLATAPTSPAPPPPATLPATTSPGPATTVAPSAPPAVPTSTQPVLIAPAPSSTPTTVAGGDDEGGSGAGMIIGVVAAVIVGAIAFVVLRSRASRAPRPT